MEYVKTKNEVIEKALANKVTNENIKEKLDLEEIVYINRMKEILNCFSIESALYTYSRFSLADEAYKSHLELRNKKEVEEKRKIEIILHDALNEIPKEIEKLIACFLINLLEEDYESIEKNRQEVFNSPQCAEYIKIYEDKLCFYNPYIKTRTVQYIKLKYSTNSEYGSFDLICNITGSDFIGLLYILHE